MSKKLLALGIALALCLMNSSLTTAHTAQTPSNVTSAASSLWNGDIPSAEIIYSFFYKGSTRYEQPLKSHGYVLTDNVTTKKAVKPGFCEMEFKFKDAGAELEIRLDDESGREWLVDNIQKYINTTLDPDYTVTLQDDVIHFDWTIDI